jgi:hypothetical protein
MNVHENIVDPEVQVDAAELVGVGAAGRTAVGACGLGNGGMNTTAVVRMTLQDVLREPSRAQLRLEAAGLVWVDSPLYFEIQPLGKIPGFYRELAPQEKPQKTLNG